MIRPPILKSNDKVVIVSPSGKVVPFYINETISILKRWGLEVEVAKNALGEVGSFSGLVEERLEDLQSAMDDPEVRLIFCSRGGYGAVHLLEQLNFDRIKINPKWLLGFSDITALHSTFQRNGIMSIHAPMAKHFAVEGDSDLSVQYIKDVITGKPLDYTISVSSHLNRQGEATGRLFGGNLSVLTSLLGSKYIYIPKDGMLFIEDIGEKPYKVDRMFRQLKISGIFNKIKGLIIGQFTEYEEDPNMYEGLYESIFTVINEFSFPVCFDFPAGHTKLNFPLIMGENATLTVGKDSILLQQ